MTLILHEFKVYNKDTKRRHTCFSTVLFDFEYKNMKHIHFMSKLPSESSETVKHQDGAFYKNNDWKPLTNFAKSSIFDKWQDSGYNSEFCVHNCHSCPTHSLPLKPEESR